MSKILIVLILVQVSFYHRNVGRQQAQQAQWLQKRRQENAQRRCPPQLPGSRARFSNMCFSSRPSVKSGVVQFCLGKTKLLLAAKEGLRKEDLRNLRASIAGMQQLKSGCFCRAAGEEPLPEEDPVQFKPIPEPSPLDGYLLNNQISNCCDQMHQFSTKALQKLHLVESMQTAGQ